MTTSTAPPQYGSRPPLVPLRVPPAPPLPGERRWLPALATLAALFGIIVSGVVAAGAVEDRPLAPVEVGGRVRVRPLPGWEFARRLENGGVVLTNGSAVLIAIVPAAPTPPEAALRAAIATETEDSDGRLIFGPVERVDLDASGTYAPLASSFHGNARGFAYPIEGEYIALDAPGGAVLFASFGEEGFYRAVVDEARQMIMGSEFR